MRLIMALVIGFFILFAAGTYLSYAFKRSWNYNWAYKSRVEQTVCEMVKPEYLIDPNDC